MKRLRLTAIIMGVLLLGAFLLYHALNREPRYEGRTLTQWVAIHEVATLTPAGDANALKTLQAATNAVRHIGAEAIPILLKKLATHESPLKRHLKPLGSGLVGFFFKNPMEEKMVGYFGFCILGEEARSAMPDLVKLIKNPDKHTRRYALASLKATHPEREILVPILVEMLQDPDQDLRMLAALDLKYVSPETAEKEDVVKMFPWLKSRAINNVSTNAAEVNHLPHRKAEANDE